MSQHIRGNLYVFNKQQSITFRDMNLDEVLGDCFSEYNWYGIVEIYEVVMPSGKILNRRQIERLWERMGFIKVGANCYFKGR